MAIEKVIEILAKTDKAVVSVKELQKMLKGTTETTEDLNKATEETNETIQKEAKKSATSVKGIGKASETASKGLKTIGTAFKAIGIGLIIGLVAKFTEVMSKNQVVVDTVSDVMNTLSIIFNEVIGKMIDAFKSASEATGGFDALGKVIGGLVKGSLSALGVAINTLKLGFQSLQLAYEKVFGDDKDVKKVEASIKATTDAIKKGSKDVLENGKQIASNIGEAVGEVVDGVSIITNKAVDAISEIDTKAAYAQAQALTRSQKNFELLALQQARLQLQYQNQAELQRQIRDDDSKGITERINANNELAGILDKQFQAEKGTIQQRINAIQLENSLLGTTQERQNEIYQLQTDLIDVEERLNGARSEQLTNTNALLREQNDLSQTIADGENERAIAQKEFEAEQQETELLKLEKQKEALLLQQEQDLAELERKKLLYEEDTQARIDAEQTYLTAKQEIANEILANDKAASDEKIRIKKEEEAKQKAIDEAVKDTTVDLTGKTLDILGGLAKEGTALAKGVAVAQATMNTYQGITAALSATSVIPDPFGSALKFVNAGLIGVAGAINVKKILSTKATKGGGGGSVDAGAATPTAPSFNLVQGTGTNQIAESLASEKQPLKAYVVASEMTTQQSLERNIEGTASV